MDAFDANRFVLETMLEKIVVAVASPSVDALKAAEFASNVLASSEPTFNVATVPDVPWKLVTKRSVVVTWFKVPFVAVKVWRLVLPETFRPVEFNVAMEPEVAVRLVALKAVLVAFVAVPFVKVRPCRFVTPSTVKVDVTVDDDPTKPPKSPSVLVVEAPFVVMFCKVDVEADEPGQFVPSARQTLVPFTSKPVDETVPFTDNASSALVVPMPTFPLVALM